MKRRTLLKSAFRLGRDRVRTRTKATALLRHRTGWISSSCCREVHSYKAPDLWGPNDLPKEQSAPALNPAAAISVILAAAIGDISTTMARRPHG